MRAELRQHQPDVVHVHNFFPRFSPSVFHACSDAGVPVVLTLHNFRTICAGGLLLRDGKVCEKCVGHSPYWGALHRCYRKSLAGSLAVARMIDHNNRIGTWQDKVTRFIVLNRFARDKFVAAGLPAARMTVKPNFVVKAQADISTPDSEDIKTRTGGLFVGRLSEEKGVSTLLAAWAGQTVPLRIAGTGPLLPSSVGSDKLGEQEIAHAAAAREGSAVKFLGAVPPAQVRDEMARAAFLIVPSMWYEMFPMVIAEAFAAGLPVIASRLGGLAEIVEDGRSGLHFTPGDSADLATKIRWAIDNPEKVSRMGDNARTDFDNRYSEAVNLGQLTAIYQDAIAAGRAEGRKGQVI